MGMKVVFSHPQYIHSITYLNKKKNQTNKENKCSCPNNIGEKYQCGKCFLLLIYMKLPLTHTHINAQTWPNARNQGLSLCLLSRSIYCTFYSSISSRKSVAVIHHHHVTLPRSWVQSQPVIGYTASLVCSISEIYV